MLGPISTLTDPPAVFFTPFSCYRVGKKEPGGRVSVTANVPPPHRKYFCPGTHHAASKTAGSLGFRQKVVYGYSSIQRRNSGIKCVRDHLTPHRTPQKCFHSPLYRGRKKRSLGVQCRRDSTPPHRNYFLSRDPPHLTPHRIPAVFSFSSIQREEKRSLGVQCRRACPPAAPKIFLPGTHPIAPKTAGRLG